MSLELSKVYSKYLSVPYLNKGRAITGWDCYGLYRYVYHEVFGIWVGSFAEQYADSDKSSAEIAATIRGFERFGWQRVENAVEGTGVVFNIAGEPLHCGYVLWPGTMLHSMRGRGTCVERYDGIAWQKRVEGFYKWAISS